MTTQPTVSRPVAPLLGLSLCLLLLGINGIIGGFLMVSDPNGSPMGMPVSDLENTPFDSFFLPGLVLIFIWGGGGLLTLAGLWFKPHWSKFDRLEQRTGKHWAWTASIMLGLALLVWVAVQIFTLPSTAPIQIMMIVLAILLVSLPLLPSMRRYYGRHPRP